MAFFVVQRDADSALSIPLPSAYPTREAAIAALSAATSAGTLILTGEVFIADLGTAVPVLVMQAAPPQPSAEAGAVEPDSHVSEPADAEPVEEMTAPADLDEASADAVYAAPLLGDEQSLAAALKRAATSLEEEGIIAPESVAAAEEQADAEDRPWEWTNVEAYEAPDEPETASPPVAEVDAELQAAASDVDVPVEAAALGGPLGTEDERDLEPVAAPGASDDTPDGMPATDSQPEAEDTPAPSETDEAAPDDEPSPYVEAPIAEIAAPLGATGAEAGLVAELSGLNALDSDPLATQIDVTLDDAPILTSAPAPGEAAYVPRPVILGDYADAVVPVLEPEPEPVAVEPLEVDVEHPVGLELTDDPLSAVLADSIEGAYEATGELDLGGYTCQDCVYANTCPKVGQATPSDCGSFQWRSE